MKETGASVVQPQGEFRADVADVVAAPGQFGPAGAVVEARPQADADARFTAQPFDRADDHRGPEGAAELLEPGREVGDPHRGVVAVAKRRDQDRGVLQVVLLAALKPFEHDVEEAAGFGVAVAAAAQERVEHRVAVEVRQAGPADAAARIDQGAEPAIPDHAAVGAGGPGRASWAVARQRRQTRRRLRVWPQPPPHYESAHQNSPCCVSAAQTHSVSHRASSQRCNSRTPLRPYCAVLVRPVSRSRPTTIAAPP